MKTHFDQGVYTFEVPWDVAGESVCGDALCAPYPCNISPGIPGQEADPIDPGHVCEARALDTHHLRTSPGT